MNKSSRDLDQRVQTLLDQDEYRDHPLYEALSLLWTQSQDQVERLERITRISDGFQAMARQRELSLAERYNKQLRQLERVTQISDRYQSVMRDQNIELLEASTRDALTGLANRRLLMNRLSEECERVSRAHPSFAIVMLDVDHFKLINDQFGHDAGDKVLIKISRTIEAELREYDLCGRWGGEEFLVFLPNTDLAAAEGVVQRIRHGIRNMQLQITQTPILITVSAGLTVYQKDETASETINRADHALLQAKRDGRDRLVLGIRDAPGAR